MKKFSPKISKIVKEIVIPLCGFLLLASVVLTFANPVMAQTSKSPGSVLSELEKQVNLPSYNTNAHANASIESGASNITSAILYAVDYAKYIMGTLAVFMIILSGIRMITSARQVDQVAEKQKENLKYIIFGLVVMMLADVMVKQAFFGEQGEIFRSQAELIEAAKKGTNNVKGLYNMIEYFAASLAVLMIVIGGFRLVTSAGNEEVEGKVKKQITWAVVGLVVMGLSEFVVKDIIFPSQGTKLPNIVVAKQLIVKITNFVSGFAATVSVVMYIYAGYLYVIAFGQEDNTGKAKKVILGATVGLLLAMAAFGVVNTFVRLENTSVTQQAGSGAPAGLPTNP